MNEDIITTLTRYIATEILKQPNRQISPEERLISSGMIDSFHLVDLSLFIEDTFGVHIDDTELNSETFDSLIELEAIIRQRQA
jgi:acyl carrier protein